MTTLEHLANLALRIDLTVDDLTHDRLRLRALVIRARNEGATLAEIARMIGVSAPRVHQLSRTDNAVT